MVSTGNLDGDPSVDGALCRDFTISSMIKALNRVFKADIEDKRIVLHHPQLVWVPDQQRHIFLNIISAKKTIYHQDF